MLRIFCKFFIQRNFTQKTNIEWYNCGPKYTGYEMSSDFAQPKGIINGYLIFKWALRAQCYGRRRADDYCRCSLRAGFMYPFWLVGANPTTKHKIPHELSPCRKKKTIPCLLSQYKWVLHSNYKAVIWFIKAI